MAKNYREALRILGRKLGPSAASTLDHPSAKGDHREDLFRDVLRTRTGASFEVTKAEVIDSDGNTTGEFDSVVYDHRVGSCVAEENGRQVVRVESVAATIEVKSTLTSNDLAEIASGGNKLLRGLKRYYRPTELLRFVKVLDKKSFQDEVAVLASGINAMRPFQSVPAITNFVFAYDGIGQEAASKHLHSQGVDVVSVLGKYTIAKADFGYPKQPLELVLWAEGEDAFGAFIFLVEQALMNYLEAEKYVLPAWKRYFFPPTSITPHGGSDR